MTLWNPLTLWDVGFQLSGAATAGLILVGPPLTDSRPYLREDARRPLPAAAPWPDTAARQPEFLVPSSIWDLIRR